MHWGSVDFSSHSAATNRNLRSLLFELDFIVVAHFSILLQLDINNSFLQGNLDEEVYMRLLVLGILNAKTICLLWVLLNPDLIPRSSFCINGFTVYILAYVDDTLVTGNHQRGVHYNIEALSKRFSLKDLGPLHYFLSVKVIRSSTGLLLSQQKYTMDLLHEVAMDNCKGVSTPMTSIVVFDPSPDDHLVDGSFYRRIIGKLHYLSFTRPDIAYDVSKLSQAMHQPLMSHWVALKRLLCYLSSTTFNVVHIAKESDRRLLSYSDSDWAGDPHDRTSTIGYVIYLGRSPILWSLKKQRSVFRSSTEAEYRAVAAAASETNWLTHLLQEL
uniref:Uncharacterized mitochondrial protein AtMg00810-like n=1 Tax=Nicotiana tabacum TaxID=4097 RepID=A0A1S4A903_TOBAC|nr:PREDICTED: uncharacterized mitochondrial protein AtMg00810-like [Nicotiana tabacum]